MGKYSLYGYEFELPKEVLEFYDTYSNAQKMFNDMEQRKDTYKEEIEEKYFKYVKTCDDFDENLPDALQIYLNKFISNMCEKLVRLGIFNINEERFINKYFMESSNGNLYYSQALDMVYNYIDELDKYAQVEKHYRENRKDNRGRFIGGGFGVKGAIKGVAAAEGLNLFTGILHSVKNGMGNTLTSIELERKKIELAKNSEIKRLFTNAISKDMKNVIQAGKACFFDFLENQLGGIYDFDREESQIIFSNINKYRNISDEILKKNIVDIIVRDPYFFKVYEFGLLRMGDHNRELEKMASLWGIDLKSQKEDILLHSYENNYKSKEYKEIYELLSEKAKYLGIDLKSTSLSEKLNNLEIEENTYMGNCFNDKELLNDAKEETKKCKTIIDNMDYDNTKSLLKAKEMLLKCNLKYCEESDIVQKIDHRIVEIDQQSRTYMGIVLNTLDEVQEANKVTESAKAICNKTNIASWDSLEKAYCSLNKLDKRFIEDSEQYNVILQLYKTADEARRKFRNSLYDTYEEKEKAEQESLQIDSILESMNYSSINSIEDTLNTLKGIKLEAYHIQSIINQLNDRIRELEILKIEYNGNRYSSEQAKDNSQHVDEIMANINEIRLDNVNNVLEEYKKMDTTNLNKSNIVRYMTLLDKILKYSKKISNGNEENKSLIKTVGRFELVTNINVLIIRVIKLVVLVLTTYINGRTTGKIYGKWKEIYELGNPSSTNGGLVFWLAILMGIITLAVFIVLLASNTLYKNELRDSFLEIFWYYSNKKNECEKNVASLERELENLVSQLMQEIELANSSLVDYKKLINKQYSIKLE